jgi:hypothetical protein
VLQTIVALLGRNCADHFEALTIHVGAVHAIASFEGQLISRKCVGHFEGALEIAGLDECGNKHLCCVHVLGVDGKDW